MISRFEKGYAQALLDIRKMFWNYSKSFKQDELYTAEEIDTLMAFFIQNKDMLCSKPNAMDNITLWTASLLQKMVALLPLQRSDLHEFNHNTCQEADRQHHSQ